MLSKQKSANDRQAVSRVGTDDARIDERLHAAEDGNVISLLALWHIILPYKWMILAIMISSTLAVGAAGWMITPVYRAEVLVAPVVDSDDHARYATKLGELGGIAAMAGVNLDNSGRKNEAIALLRSRILTEQMIKDNKLLPVLFHRLWDEENQRWDVDDPDDMPTLWDAWELFDKKIRRVNEDRKTGLVILSIDWEDPLVAASWANELVVRVNAMLRKKASEESENAIRYLQEQLKQTSVVELQQVLNRMVEAEMKEVIFANIDEEYAFKVIDPAIGPEKAYKPVLAPMVGLGAILGLVVGIILAMYLNFLHANR